MNDGHCFAVRACVGRQQNEFFAALGRHDTDFTTARLAGQFDCVCIRLPGHMVAGKICARGSPELQRIASHCFAHRPIDGRQHTVRDATHYVYPLRCVALVVFLFEFLLCLHVQLDQHDYKTNESSWGKLI